MAEQACRGRSAWTPGIERRIEPFETTLCGRKIPVAFPLAACSALGGENLSPSFRSEYPNTSWLDGGHGARWRRAEVWVWARTVRDSF